MVSWHWEARMTQKMVFKASTTRRLNQRKWREESIKEKMAHSLQVLSSARLSGPRRPRFSLSWNPERIRRETLKHLPEVHNDKWKRVIRHIVGPWWRVKNLSLCEDSSVGSPLIKARMDLQLSNCQIVITLWAESHLVVGPFVKNS